MYADRLDRICKMNAKEAENGDRLMCIRDRSRSELNRFLSVSTAIVGSFI